MMKLIIPVLLVCVALLTACDGRDAKTTKRIGDLQDSLKAYRDTLESERLSFRFNTVAPIVRLRDYVIQKGDSCHAEVFIAGMNGKSQDYTYREPLLVLSDSLDTKGDVIMKKSMGSWAIDFLPAKEGVDSIMGKIKYRCQGCSDTMELSFMTKYTVRP